MSSSIFNGFKDGVLFAIAANYQVIIKLGLSLQILHNTLRYTGKSICVTSFSGIPHADLKCGAEKIQHSWIFYPRIKSPARDPREWK